ncbi:MAG: hypothetical protein M0Z69_05430 [Actinomycetota bacterium]|nr:hypothetical protein [Actinomycetota bacterium]
MAPGDRSPAGWLHLGYSDLAWQLRPDDDELFGKWCRRCEGLWFGLALEVACPCCQGRTG